MIDKNCSCEHEKEHEHEHVSFFRHMAKGLFPFICLGLGLLIDYIARILGQPILSTVFLLVLGFALPASGYFLLVGLDMTVQWFVDEFTWASLESHEIMLALLPILIFESAFAIEAHEFGKHFWEIIILAGPCFLAGFFILAFWMYPLVNLLNLPGWTISVCLLYSAVISATDPVAVVMLLSKLGVPHRLRLLVEGESLLNDGVAIILFNIMNLVVQQEDDKPQPHGKHKEEISLSSAIFWKIFNVSVSVLLGMFAGRMLGWLLVRMRDTLRERATIVLFVFGVYCICETTEGSGVLGVVAFALILNSLKEGISYKSAEDNRSMWQFLAYWANWILFLLTGLVACQNWQKSTQSQVYTSYRLVALGSWAYVGAFFCRFISLAVYTLLATLIGKKFHHWHLPWSYTTILTWGGLRGSIALLLAMQMGDDKQLDTVSPAALGCVSFTVLVSNTYHTLTANYVAERSGLTQISDAKTQRIESLTQSLNRHIRTIRKAFPTMHAYFWSEAFWDKVEELSTFAPQTEEEEETEADVAEKETKLEANVQELAEEETLHRLTIMSVMGAYARTLGESEVISTVSIRYIINAINEAVDRSGPLDVTRLYFEVQPYSWLRSLSVTVKQHMLDRFENWCDNCARIKLCFLGKDYKLSSDWWQVIWHLVVFLHCVLLYFYYTYKTADKKDLQYILYGLFLCSIVLAIEIVIRTTLISEELGSISNRTFWHVYDFIRFIIYLGTAILIAIILERCFKIPQVPENSTVATTTFGHNGTVFVTYEYCTADTWYIGKFRWIVLLAPLFCFVALPFWLFYLVPRVFIMELHDYIVKADNLTLELMHGILMLSEHVLQRLESETGIVLDSADMRRKFETENMNMKREAEIRLIALFNSQTANSKRMVYLKTRQVTRMILTEGLTVLEQKFKSGEIDEYEYHELEKIFSYRMQITQEMFANLPPTPFESRLKLVPWIAESKQKRALIQFIKEKAKLITFKPGEYLLRQGEEANGAFFLMSGICRFAINDGKENKKLHLLYAGQFVGEKSFLLASAVGSGAPMPKRTGSIYAETDVETYFLDSSDTKNIVKIDSSIARTFEENDVILSCKDYIRKRQPYSLWTAPVLEDFIKKRKRTFDRHDTIDVKEGSSIVLIKGEFEVNGQKVTVKPPKFPIKLEEGPCKGIQVFGSEALRCFTLELSEARIAQQDSDSEMSSSHGSSYNVPVKASGTSVKAPTAKISDKKSSRSKRAK